jgi:hypothetical protein
VDFSTYYVELRWQGRGADEAVKFLGVGLQNRE